jgi:hypothetical protein
MIRMLKIHEQRQLVRTIGLSCFFLAAPLFIWPTELYSQDRRHIKVLLESQQFGNFDRGSVQGSGSVIIRRDSVRPSGRLGAVEKETKVQRSTGIFTLVGDGGESILTVATRVPYSEVSFYRDYATGTGYLTRGVVFNDVGTSLKVSATILPDNQIQLRLTPRISYFSPERSGAIDFVEEKTEIVVPNGHPVSLGGSVTKMHEVTRQIFGFSNRTSTQEANLVVTATVQ